MWPFNKNKPDRLELLTEIQTGVINMDMTSKNIKHKLVQVVRLAKALDDLEEGEKLQITLPDNYQNATIKKVKGKVNVYV